MPSHNTGRMAIITGGATIVFQELLDEVVSAKFFRALVDNGFETVLIQTGAYEKEVNRLLADLQPLALKIEVVPFLPNMKDHMELCRGLIGGRPAGVVISHAGELHSRLTSPMCLALSNRTDDAPYRHWHYCRLLGGQRGEYHRRQSQSHGQPPGCLCRGHG